MAFDLQTFKTRALSAIIFVVVMLGAIFYSLNSFIILFLIVHTGCLIEYNKLTKNAPAIHTKTAHLLYSLFGLAYMTASFFAITHLASAHWAAVLGTTQYYVLPMLVIVSIWINDDERLDDNPFTWCHAADPVLVNIKLVCMTIETNWCLTREKKVECANMLLCESVLYI